MRGDYSEYIVTEAPPEPSPTVWHRVESWFRPVQFATEGRGLSWEGHVRSKRFWILRRGVLRISGIDHIVHTEPFRRTSGATEDGGE